MSIQSKNKYLARKIELGRKCEARCQAYISKRTATCHANFCVPKAPLICVSEELHKQKK